jgi:2-polyprenyl-3-methyl-5-hydroxy-6-metoxy-1,4-benzoquinol methylase
VNVSILDWKWRISSQEALIRQWLSVSEPVLDVGCGASSPLISLGLDELYGVDGFEPSAIAARESGAYKAVACREIIDYMCSVPDRAFSAVVGLDVIEHFPKEDGARLIQEMERVARRIVVIATPNGFLRQGSTENPHQVHLSGWSAADFIARSYAVKGLYGLKWLRGEGHELRIRRSSLLMAISHLTAPVALVFPRIAAGLICIKKI